ncbi:MAG: divalent-cation tolerance protein CutA [Deltaproteobacteria bacterium]
MRDKFVVVFSTAPNQKAALRIAKSAVKDRLAACCNIVPGLRSIYVWKERLCDEKEVLCVFKTRKAMCKKLENRIKELHPYEVPEIIAVDIDSGFKGYLEWIHAATRAGRG